MADFREKEMIFARKGVADSKFEEDLRGVLWEDDDVHPGQAHLSAADIFADLFHVGHYLCANAHLVSSKTR